MSPCPSESGPWPLVSIVVAAYNEESSIGDAVTDLLAQTYESFECVAVDDGSTDRTAAVLKSIAATDPRLKVIVQPRSGLTRALIRGCDAAQGELIARHDVGDVSLSDRVARQVRYLKENPRVVAVGCGVRWIGPAGEFLGEWVRHQTPEQTTQDLVDHGTGFVHPSVMFRRDAYLKAGGYRPQFRFAQDHDLWYRMAEQGLLATCPDVLFEYRMDISGISPDNRTRQLRLGEIARECYFARREGRSEAALLEAAQRVSSDSSAPAARSKKSAQGAAAYFVGSQLYRLKDQRCRSYLRIAFRAGASPLRAAWKLTASFFTCGHVKPVNNHA